MTTNRVFALAAAALGLAAAPAAAQEAAGVIYTLPTVEIVGTTPVSGVGIAKEKVAANVQRIGRDDLEQGGALGLGGVLNRRLGSVTINEAQTNPLQPDVQFRGFTASPVLGNPQGIAVYQNGVRVNEPLGDVVQWDVIPEFALDSVEVIAGSNPVYGLNALGGAIALRTKNGFDFRGVHLTGSGGSFSRYRGTGEYGAAFGANAVYIGASGFDEQGWRDESPSDLAQVFADFRHRGDALELALNLTLARTDLNGNGTAPVELLAQRRDSVFTFPDVTENRLAFVEIQGDYFARDDLSFAGNLYFRHLERDTLNGDEQDFEACTGVAGPATTLCQNPGADEEQVLDLAGNPVPTTVGGDGAFNSSTTNSNGVGGTVQATLSRRFLGLANHFVLGGSVDLGSVRFADQSEVGFLTADRTVSGSGIFVGGNAFNTRLETRNRFLGAFLSDTLSLTDRLAVTFSGRFNHATIELDDRFGTELNGDHSFNRFNPAVGFAYTPSPELTGYVSYSEANRVPSAVELSCADATQPCRVPNAFLSDPPLAQVVSRSLEIGARGRATALGGDLPLGWSVAAFGSRNFDDIIFVGAGSTTGSGFFQNAGITQRVGIEAGLDGRLGPLGWFANYTFLRATFESNLSIASANHPQADANGEIQVGPGDRIPGLPLQSLKLGVDVEITKGWRLEVDSIINSSQFLRGDEANLLDPVDGYGVVNLRSSYRLADYLDVFVQVDNLFDTEYETFGLLGDPSQVLPGFSDPRFLAPGAPLGAWAGLRAAF